MSIMKNKLAVLVVALLMMIATLGTTVSASAYTTTASISRGIKYLGWAQDEITWNYDGCCGKRIRNVDTNQKKSGLCISLRGISKEKARSTTTKYSYLCKHRFLAGAQIQGVTLGFADDINDRIVIEAGGDWDYWRDV